MYIKRNIEERSCNHCCRGKVICITYSERVFVALGIQHAMRMRRTVICGLSASTIFVHIIKQHGFRKKKSVIKHKTCALIFSTTFLSETFFILRRTERDVITNVYWSLSKVYVILVRFEWNLHFLEGLSKNNYISNFKKRVQWEPSCSMRADRRTDMTKLIVAFRNFANAPKTKYRIWQNGIHENGQNKMDEANGQNIAKNKDDWIVSCRKNTTESLYERE
jgi:hypothetical protein